MTSHTFYVCDRYHDCDFVVHVGVGVVLFDVSVKEVPFVGLDVNVLRKSAPVSDSELSNNNELLLQ